MRSRVFSLVCCCLVLPLLVLTGCGEQKQSAPPPAAHVPHKPAKSPAAVPAAEAAPAAPAKYVYDPVGKRDPFENPLKEFKAKVPDGEPLTPLQKYELSQLRLIGVIIGRGQPTAMVIAPDGKSFILRKGIKVGKNNGVVVGIDQNGVKVEEKYFDFTGEVRKSIQELQLPKRGGVN